MLECFRPLTVGNLNRASFGKGEISTAPLCWAFDFMIFKWVFLVWIIDIWFLTYKSASNVLRNHSGQRKDGLSFVDSCVSCEEVYIWARNLLKFFISAEKRDRSTGKDLGNRNSPVKDRAKRWYHISWSLDFGLNESCQGQWDKSTPIRHMSILSGLD